jgi:hypothetical protein
LIAGGHAHEHVLGYTLVQFHTYLRLAQRREALEFRNAALAARAGQADAKSFKKLLADLG